MGNQVRAAKAAFRHPEIGSFFQAQPKLQNPWTGDGFLQRTLKRLLPQEVRNNKKTSKRPYFNNIN
jgi:hypothetical protein